MRYFITNKHNQPINVIGDGAGLHIQYLKSVCESYSSEKEAIERLVYLRENANRTKNLKVSTYAPGWMED